MSYLAWTVETSLSSVVGMEGWFFNAIAGAARWLGEVCTAPVIVPAGLDHASKYKCQQVCAF